MKVKVKKKPKQSNPDYDAALQCYLDNKGVVSVKKLARAGHTTQKQVRLWMTADDWEHKFKGEEPGDITRISDRVKEEVLKASDFGLDEKEELFCFHYLKTFNLTTSAIRAGFPSTSGHEYGHRLMQNPQVIAFINHLKEIRNTELLFDNSRIIQEYMKIAFADMNDFVDITKYGIRPKAGSDGQLITKIKEGRDGVSIELADKMKALEKLERYFDVMPDDWKQAVEEKKLELMGVKLDIERRKLEDDGNGSDSVPDDGFLEALGVKAKEVWSEDDEAEEA